MAPFDAILFDLDNTLCTNDQSGETVYAGAFDAAGLDRFGEPSDLWTALDGPPDHDDHEGYLADGFERVAAKHDREVDVRALARGFVETVDHSAVSFRPGAEAALAAARDHASVGLVTNGPERRQSIKLDALGIADAFDAVVFAGDMPRRKPHPDPFDRALADLDAEANASLHVGDSLEFDVDGAHRAGLDAAWCPVETGTEGDLDPTSHAPAYVLRSLTEFSAILDGGP
ncbi:HAD family hydrolase [Haloferax sp. Atlit-12N]|uniref:HAD family hydrolase n=1 Tax=Haloferax sp. Atlit-12N TaxID=2077203 RepID=UPI000E241935|nr:HAD family hydrolase [Haloferax sp. Atlit-12N]RDZ64849.1 HAD family hydrolase [Haloferax sp. Atlit-12N]